MRKIIGFDSWTQGAHNYKRVASELKANGFQLILIHLGSWGHDVHSPTDQIDGDIVIRDISFYSKKSFVQILRIEKPDAVIFLSTTALAHRAFNRYCKMLDIPTIHLYHGLVSVQSIDSERLNPINIYSQLLILIGRASINLFKIIPLYINSLFTTNAKFKDWQWFFVELIRKVLAKSYSGIAPPDSSTSIICVYVEADIMHAVNRYWSQKSDVYVIGNPDLINFNIEESSIGFRLRDKLNFNNISDEVIYIDNGFIDVGAIFDNSFDYLNHLKKTRDAVNLSGLKFSIKLHPIHYRTGLIDLLKIENIEILSKDNFHDRLLKAKGCIVEPSSAAIVPALMGLPILLAKYDKLDSQDYGYVLSTYPKSNYLTNLDNLNKQFEVLNQNINIDSCESWINLNVGPLPSHLFPSRFFEALKSCVKSQSS